MKKLKSTFEEVFGLPFSVLSLPDYELHPFEKTADTAFLFGSAAALEEPFLVDGKIFGLELECPPKYFLVGFWGHGANSYAFYYSRSDAWSKICFRLPYGGAYMDNDKAAADIARFLPAYFKYEAHLMRRGCRLVAIDSMGDGLYKIETEEGQLIEHQGSLLQTAAFEQILGTDF